MAAQSSSAHWNYPRSRGEECASGSKSSQLVELPPLARGRDCPPYQDKVLPGITPARAGKSSPATSRWLRLVELPPLARGRVSIGFIPDRETGITPARAGKSCRPAHRTVKNRNYPRSRGEEFAKAASIATKVELPPLARGRALLAFITIGVPGITPARAGKSPR